MRQAVREGFVCSVVGNMGFPAFLFPNLRKVGHAIVSNFKACAHQELLECLNVPSSGI